MFEIGKLYLLIQSKFNSVLMFYMDYREVFHLVAQLQFGDRTVSRLRETLEKVDRAHVQIPNNHDLQTFLNGFPDSQERRMWVLGLAEELDLDLEEVKRIARLCR